MTNKSNNIINFILNSDSYKFSHHQCLNPEVTRLHSYIESRGGDYDSVVFYGLQAFLKQYLASPITEADILEAKSFINSHIGEGVFNEQGWRHILLQHKGKLPIIIRAIPEGTVVDGKNVLLTIENTDPKCAWLTSFVETALLRAIWFASTVATRSKHIKNIILEFLEKTGTPDSVAFKLHDFGMRGCSSFETGNIGGSAHLVNFLGTDTISSIKFAQENYNTDEMLGFSIPASEHSISTSYGAEGERDYIRTMLKFLEKTHLVAMVADTFNVYEFCMTLGNMKKEIEESTAGGKCIVVRPDSGKPVEVIEKVLDILFLKFGSYTNDKGYKVLPDYIRVIQGDGVNENSIREILEMMESRGYSADNIVFGMGGELLQTPNRDTLKFAMKASAIEVTDRTGRKMWKGISKSPITDSGKRSKEGRLSLYRDENGKYYTKSENENYSGGLLNIVYQNGEIVKQFSFDEVRANSMKP